MNISHTKSGDKLTIYVEGRIDSNSSPALTEYIQRYLEGIKEFVLDLAQVDYISSAGLRTILLAQKTMDNNKGKMSVAHVSDDIMETFELTCFTDFLTII